MGPGAYWEKSAGRRVLRHRSSWRFAVCCLAAIACVLPIGCGSGGPRRLQEIAKGQDPFFGKGDYIPAERGLAKSDDPPGLGKGMNGPSRGPSTDLTVADPNKPGGGVTLGTPTTLGRPPASLLGGDKPNHLSIDTPPGPGRVDPSVRRMSLTPDQSANWAEVQSALRARGVTWQRLQMTADGQWEFECLVADPANPDLARGYRARAADGVSAMRAVLDELGR